MLAHFRDATYTPVDWSLSVVLHPQRVTARFPVVHPVILNATLNMSLDVKVPVGVMLSVPVSPVVCSAQLSVIVHPVPIVRGEVSEKSVSGRSCVFSSNMLSYSITS